MILKNFHPILSFIPRFLDLLIAKKAQVFRISNKQ
jgi:hypothetical protein